MFGRLVRITVATAFTGYLIPLVAVTAPPDYPGPLKVV